MIAYNCDLNTILKEAFANRKNKYSIRSYSLIMNHLSDRGHKVDVQILENEVSAEFKRVIVDNWGATYQLLPPNVHRQKIYEQAIRTFKAHFLSVLAVVDPDFPKFMWYNLLGETELTLNFLRQATLTHVFQRGNISMAHLTMQKLCWVPLDVKLSIKPRQTISNPGINEDAKYLV